MADRKDEDWKYALSLSFLDELRVFSLKDAKTEGMRLARLNPNDTVCISDRDGHSFRSYYMDEGKLMDCRIRYIVKEVDG